jgi:hypothetical protein
MSSSTTWHRLTLAECFAASIAARRTAGAERAEKSVAAKMRFMFASI